ncbi:LysE family translocator [Kitasatospora sp. NA04385]|uniref:LysE family translocator n=1 Tax=Kitasatospora sp. NA04385 TaxID=2742135 RepID=UPI00159237A2|nr:LysE family translocator [Kitasatospora sp. NA04385]QKW18496.1 LysE family translocator [Kitasatospora sp. NA04385]
MPTARTVAGFLLALLPLIATPGASLALLVRQIGEHGRRRAVPVVLGTVTGLAVHAGLALAGLAGLTAHHPGALTAVRIAGGAYLIGLAVLTWRSAGRAAGRRPRHDGPAFVQALLANVLNPKAASIYLTLLPQFLDAARPLPAQVLVLAAAHAALLAAWLLGWTALLARTAPRPRPWATRATAAVLLALGLRALA